MTNAPRPSPAQVKLIDDLGGPKAVADAINERLSLDLTGQAVSNWRTRGIPYCYRGTFVMLAQKTDISLPGDFFGIVGNGDGD